MKKHSELRFDGLKERVRGRVLERNDAGFDAARSIWNGMIDKAPAVIVRCRGAADVMAAVEFARESELPVSIKGGGHNVAGKAICDGGVMIDLSQMNQVTVDPVARLARAGGGALWADFDHEAQAFGLACTGGVVSTTGVAGLTLGGGIGYLTRTYGLACDNLIAADVVTAGGTLVKASEAENPDLLWALRGAGSNFGVVTSLEFELHEVGPLVASAVCFYPMEAAATVLRSYRDYAQAAPDEVACYAMFVNGPSSLPPVYQNKPVLVLVACYSRSSDDGLEVLAPLGGFGGTIATTIGKMPYKLLQTSFDAGNPSGKRYYWKSQHLAGLPDELLNAIVRYASDLHGTLTIIGIEPLGGALSRMAPSATAFPHRNVPFSLGIWTGWENPAEDASNIAWTRSFFDAVKPFSAGAYVNYLAEDEDGRVEEAYGDNYPRLVELKRKWDPGNLFRVNQNIAP